MFSNKTAVSPFYRMLNLKSEHGNLDAVVAEPGSLDALYAALSKTNQEPVVREFLEAVRPR